MLNLSILGSTGSIGNSALELVRLNPGIFKVGALSCRGNLEGLIPQIEEFKPGIVCLSSHKAYKELKNSKLSYLPRVVYGDEGVDEIIENAEIVLNAISGFSGLKPMVKAIESDKKIAVANKECFVVAGNIINKMLEVSRAEVVPVDSEHSSLMRCILGERKSDIKKYIITASGGPFLNTPKKDFTKITVEQALKHPKWKMGSKITIDSATLFNKGLEVIEALMLFKLDPQQVKVLVHPQSLIHAGVEYIDNSLKLFAYSPDMKIPIAHSIMHFAAEYSQYDSGVHPISLKNLSDMQFFEVDHDKFPSINLCLDAYNSSSAHLVALNCFNEEAVSRFLTGDISFNDIYKFVEQGLCWCVNTTLNTLDDIVLFDKECREYSKNIKV